MVDEELIYYLIQPNIPGWFPQTAGAVSCTLEGKGSFVLDLVQGFLQGTPLIAVLIITICMFILPPSIAKVVRRISLIGIIVTYLYYARKIIRFLYKTVMNKGIDYGGINVVCEQESDFTVITTEHIALIKQFQEGNAVQKTVVYQGALHMKQQTRKVSLWKSIVAIFFTRERPTNMYDAQIQTTIQNIFSTSFIWVTTPHA